jgi:hypothetical protein
MTDEVAKYEEDNHALTVGVTDSMDRSESNSNTLQREDTEDTIIRFGKLKLRGKTDDLPQYVADSFPRHYVEEE